MFVGFWYLRVCDKLADVFLIVSSTRNPCWIEFRFTSPLTKPLRATHAESHTNRLPLLPFSSFSSGQ